MAARTAGASDLHTASAEARKKWSEYLAGEMNITLEDYALLSSMNLAAADTYKELEDHAIALNQSAEKLRTASAALAPEIAHIDELEAQVGELEAAVLRLDSYSKRLEEKFEALII
mmetsp:Transcript_12734/g.27482  ORF Transcript_12734/g.27482 Transcript_12734/m.27482 type:complete len:116 (-) Transcript_12734:830-1177(-)|eukprot:CAMPEP_0183340884 /NCGR_PEP_ID=MMETSP0164_2-20130417/7285_1 /TAXON_ID=221442 /ORGANISM="Coccolithus pelagicus ssp braarudi, Strain PLY182g" /LENGTH=115 /DNA_ID=CAMNT_0025511089 /DNA_START=18 /DNA_END=365 /DNA_ORIENTATION=+